MQLIDLLEEEMNDSWLLYDDIGQTTMNDDGKDSLLSPVVPKDRVVVFVLVDNFVRLAVKSPNTPHRGNEAKNVRK